MLTAASVMDLDFAHAFNAGGTMVKCSNYDIAPPVRPAYGIWRRAGRNSFDAKHEFCVTKAPARLEHITEGGGWLSTGRGFLWETITLSDDGERFASTIRYEAFEQAGKLVEGGVKAVGRSVRLRF